MNNQYFYFIYLGTSHMDDECHGVLITREPLTEEQLKNFVKEVETALINRTGPTTRIELANASDIAVAAKKIGATFQRRENKIYVDVHASPHYPSDAWFG